MIGCSLSFSQWIYQWEYEAFVYPSTLVYGVLMAIGYEFLNKMMFDFVSAKCTVCYKIIFQVREIVSVLQFLFFKYSWMLLLATYIIFPIRERLTNAKQVQVNIKSVFFHEGNRVL